ncbi:MAG: hypothetical protein DMF69_14185 [Acidobacteria bacterium]|nr:MAG: hypothetical protein DMF69_14185 [Acidobacteriota bacterium]
MSDMIQSLFQKSGPAKEGVGFSASWEGRFTPAGLTKSYINVSFGEATGGKPPFPTCTEFSSFFRCDRLL